MQIFTEHYPDIHPGYPIEKLASPDRILFIDIETTGLSREKTALYLIGCGFFNGDGYHTIQWFADSYADEVLIIDEFNRYINGRFDLLLHYNGNHFDIPYLKYRANVYGRELCLTRLDSYDIYLKIKPYKSLLSLPSLRQRSIEQLLDINSDDPYTGRELISVYRNYTKHPSDELLQPLIYHNSEDLKGMAYILPILYYTDLSDTILEYVSHTIHQFEDLNGILQSEILAIYKHDAHIPHGFKTGCFGTVLALREDGSALLRIPVINTTLKQFYDNYKDYYYLPAEDCCVHKSVASGVDKSRRENAKKETCYVKHSGLFIPLLTPKASVTFRETYESKDMFIPYREENSVRILTEIGHCIIDLLNYS